MPAYSMFEVRTRFAATNPQPLSRTHPCLGIYHFSPGYGQAKKARQRRRNLNREPMVPYMTHLYRRLKNNQICYGFVRLLLLLDVAEHGTLCVGLKEDKMRP